MDIEFEATFTNINKDAIRKVLTSIGAKLIRSEYLQRRVVLSLPKGHEIKGGWLRVRDEGDKVTLTLKVVDGNQIENQREVCLKIDDFEKAEQLLGLIGCKKRAYQESKRELWQLGGVEITIDEWPFLEPYVEIEGKSKESVEEVASKMELDFSKALFCAVDKLYALKYNISEDVINNQVPELKFDSKNPFLKED
ncbi:MAG: CYTH domain-containing protein [bacterium]|nr:CYTH domain-containing protein [bacterium]